MVGPGGQMRPAGRSAQTKPKRKRRKPVRCRTFKAAGLERLWGNRHAVA